MTSPTVSVIIPTRDRQHLLTEALSSVLSQRHGDLEVVVVDDGSRDRTSEVVRRVPDGRVRLISNDAAEGAATARNLGVDAARGRWVAFLDDDDLWSPDKLSCQVAALDDGPATEWCCTGLIHIDPSGRIVGHSVPPDPDGVAALLPWWEPIPGGGSTVMATRSAVREAGGFDPALPAHEDWNLWVRLALQGRLRTVARPLAAYRMHASSHSRNLDRSDAARATIRERYAHLRTTPDEPDAASHARSRALNHLNAGDTSRSLRVLADSARRHRDWRAVVAAPAVALAPGAVRRLAARRFERRVPAAWRAEAEAWLADLRSTTSNIPARQ